MTITVLLFWMDRLRWAVNCSLWTPTREVLLLYNMYYAILYTLILKEWLRALSVIQMEEATRVGTFVYQRDAKLALVCPPYRQLQKNNC